MKSNFREPSNDMQNESGCEREEDEEDESERDYASSNGSEQSGGLDEEDPSEAARGPCEDEDSHGGDDDQESMDEVDSDG